MKCTNLFSMELLLSLDHYTDRQLLEAIAERLLLDDPSWVQEQLEKQLREEISIKWLEFVKMHNMLDGNIKVTVSISSNGHVDYYNTVVKKIVQVLNIMLYMSEVIAPNVKALVNRIVHTGPELSKCEIVSIDVTRLEDA